MSQTTGVGELTAILGKVPVFLGRPTVQMQLFLILLVACIAWFGAETIWRRQTAAHSRLVGGARSEAARTRVDVLRAYMLEAANSATFPILCLLLLEATRQALNVQGLTSGLLGKVSWILWAFLALQLSTTVLNAFFDRATVRAYYFHLLLPLLCVVVALKILDNLTDLQQMGEVVLVEVFSRPVTLGAVFIATVGLYFWTDTAHVVQDLLYQFTVVHTRADPGGTKAALTLIRYLLVIAGVVYVLSNLQLGPTTLAAVTGGLSVGVGFGLREILSNFISGALLLLEQSLHPGDVIQVNDEISVVEDVRMRATIVRTLNNDELVIPNQTFFTASFKTYTGSDKTVRVPIHVRTDCATAPAEVVRVLETCAQQHAQVLADPPPTVFVLDYGDNVANYQLNVWLDNPTLGPQVCSDIKLLVWDAFAANHIDLPTPEMHLHFPPHLALERRHVFSAQ
jgi:potassium efflux system protein